MRHKIRLLVIGVAVLLGVLTALVTPGNAVAIDGQKSVAGTSADGVAIFYTP